jgi:holo-[acyl-carrier protein] synthase
VRSAGFSASLTALAEEAGSGLAGMGLRVGTVTGVGIDAVDIERFRLLLARRASIAARLFTEGELAYAHAASDPVPRLADRFAAKEAAMKAFGVGLGAFSFGDAEVTRTGLDGPVLVLHGAAESLARRRGVGRLHLSLTHTALVAMAVVVAEGGDGAERSSPPTHPAKP